MLGDWIQHDDWKKEKHVPAIECPGRVASGEAFEVRVTVGKEIAHPNTTEHHIRWIELYFRPEGEKFAYEIGRFEFNAHGEAVAGANEGPVHTDPQVLVIMKIAKAGTLSALALCNIHGLWESTVEVKLR